MMAMKIKQIWAKRWIKISCGGVVAIVLFFLLLPVGAKYYLADWLVKNGADRATIKKLRFNPFLANIYAGGVDVELGGRSILHNASMVMDLGITSLLHHDIRLEKADYRDLAIDLEQYGDGSWRFGSYTLKGGQEETRVESKEDVASAWNFLADQVTLRNCSIHLKTPDLDLTLVVDKADLQRLTTRAGQPAGNFSFAGRLNDDPIDLQLDTVQLVPELRLGGRVAVKRFQLKQLARLLHDVLPTLAGEVALDGKLLFVQGKELGVQVNYDGNLGVTGSDLAGPGFGGKFDSLTWKGKVHYDAPVQGPSTVATDGLFAARTLHLAIPAQELETNLGQLELSGTAMLTIADNMLLENSSSLQLKDLELVLPLYGIVEKNLSWKGAVQYDSDQKQQGPFVHADGSLDLGEFEVGGGNQEAPMSMAGQMAAWQGSVGFRQKDSGRLSIVDLEGTLVGGELRTALSEPKLNFGQEKVEVKTKVTIGMGENLDIGGQSSLELQNFTFGRGEDESPVVSFDQLTIAELAGQGGKKISVKNLLTKGLQASVAGTFPLKIDIPQIELTNLLTEDLVTFTASQLQVQSPQVTSTVNEQELVRLDGVTVSNISLAEGAKVGAGELQLEKFAFLGSQDKAEKKAAVSFVKATLDSIGWSGETGLQAGTLHFDELVAAVVRDKEGNINISQQLTKMQQKAEQATEPAAAQPQATTAAQQSPATPLKLKKVVVAGKSGVYFKDYTLAVPYATDLNISRLELAGLDSTQPDKKTEFILEGELEKRAPLAVTGNIQPFKEKPKVDLQVELKNYPLSSLSAYTVQSVGTALASGQLQLKTSLLLADDKLDMKNSVLLKKLETKTITPKLAAELNNQLPIPLDAALSMLRDSDRNISLDVPLSGPVSELSVGVSDVLITALGKAILPAASGYLMYALGPYGALAYVGMKVGEKMLQVELPPVEFVQLETALTADHLQYLQRIGKILQDRPETDIQICPRVASWEFMSEQEKAAIQTDDIPVDEKLRAQLVELGQQRAKAVQSFLASEYNIDQNRLLICDTEIATKKSTVPAVLLQL